MNKFAAAVADSVGERPCVVAVGGGADSAMLLHAAIEARPRGGVRAVFAFHALEASHLLEASARKLTESLDVGLSVVDAAIVDGSDLEARARHARYTAIESTITSEELVLTGHTADDQAETVLMRLMRGSGAGGLAGIPASRSPWTRPFLGFGRRELRMEAERLGLPFVDDPANEDDRFLRSRIRHQLLPEIEKNYAPGIAGDLVRTATLLTDDDEFLSSLSAAIEVSMVSGNVALAVAAIVSAPSPVATRAIRRALRQCGDAYPGSRDDVEAVLAVARGGATAVIGGNIEVRREQPMVILAASGRQPCDPPLGLDAASSIVWGHQTYRAERRPFPVPQRTSGRFTVVLAPGPGDAARVRSFQPGDRIDIGVGSTPVSEILRDHGVPSGNRSCWPMVTIGGKIAAVHGIRAAVWATPHNGDEVMIIEREVHS
jgi:tRNA(Ile)-lysidine synthase